MMVEEMALDDMTLDDIALDEMGMDEMEMDEMGMDEMGVYNVAEMLPASDEEVLNSVEIPPAIVHLVKKMYGFETAPGRGDIPRGFEDTGHIVGRRVRTKPAVVEGDMGETS
jgi:hypothetical protein